MLIRSGVCVIMCAVSCIILTGVTTFNPYIMPNNWRIWAFCFFIKSRALKGIVHPKLKTVLIYSPSCHSKTYDILFFFQHLKSIRKSDWPKHVLWCFKAILLLCGWTDPNWSHLSLIIFNEGIAKHFYFVLTEKVGWGLGCIHRLLNGKRQIWMQACNRSYERSRV